MYIQSAEEFRIDQFDPREKHAFECWGCGIPVWLMTNQPILRVFCQDCKAEYEMNKEKTLKEYIKLKTIVMHERALRILEKQQAKLYLYKDASEVVLEFALNDPEKFYSSHEMIAAMELIRNKVKIKVQQKIGKHRVDFVIPKAHVILEIDGYMHEYKKIADSKRDKELRNELGPEWEVIRIPTKYIEQNAGALLNAIRELYKFKQKARRENNGVLPDWYSDREKMRYAKAIGIDISDEIRQSK